MSTHRAFKSSELAPDGIKRLELAFKYALRSLGLVDRDDPITDIVAKKIIEVGATERNPSKISGLAIKHFGVSSEHLPMKVARSHGPSFPLPEIMLKAITGELDTQNELRLQRASALVERLAVSNEMVWRSCQLLSKDEPISDPSAAEIQP